VFCGPNTSPTIISERNNGGAGSRTYFFYNNIIYSQSHTAQYIFQGTNYSRTIDFNAFYGIHPANEPQDPHKISTDPLFANPGSGGLSLETLDGYKLKSGSPCIDSGFLIQGHRGSDFWGNPLPIDGKIDRGAFEYQHATGAKGNGSK
jgi:hypothetical protein